MFWHIGKMKTASTFLQYNVFPYLDPIDFLGWNTKLAEKSWNSSVAMDLVNEIRFSQKFNVNVNAQRVLELRLLSPSKVLISEEGIGTDQGNFQRNILRISEIDPEARVIMVIRRQSSYLLSQYYQYQRGVFGNKRWPHISLREFLEQKFFHVSEIFYLEQIINGYKIFGRNNFFVLPYELLMADVREFSRLFSEFLGCSQKQFCKQLISATPVHLSKRRFQWARPLLEFIDNSFRARIAGILSRYYGLRNLAYNTYEESSVIDWLNEKKIDYSIENRKISSIIDIDLSRFGYH